MEKEEIKQHIEWHDDAVIKHLISYALGRMMGRYSIDKPGLILANQGDGVQLSLRGRRRWHCTSHVIL